MTDSIPLGTSSDAFCMASARTFTTYRAGGHTEREGGGGHCMSPFNSEIIFVAHQLGNTLTFDKVHGARKNQGGKFSDAKTCSSNTRLHGLRGDV